MARLDRGAGGEDALGLGLLRSLFQGSAFLHLLPDEFQREKGRMTFVHMEDRWLDAESAQQPHAADAQQNLLHDPRGAVSSVHSQCQIAKMSLVFLAIAVQ